MNIDPNVMFMRVMAVAGTLLVCSALGAVMVRPAGAISLSYPWDGLFAEHGTVYSHSLSVAERKEATRVPVDAVPWRLEPCHDEPLSDECGLRAGEQVIPVTVEATGRDACGSVEDATFHRVVLVFLRRFVPDEPLVAGRTYELECDGPDGLVFTRASSALSAPPGKLEIMGLERHRGSGCGGEDYLEVRLKGLSGTFLDEGGYIEVLSPQGEVAALRSGGAEIGLPLVSGAFRFTPIAANGERGETIEVDADDVDGSCGVHPRGDSRALWLLAPLLWSGMRTRRRRKSGSEQGARDDGQ